MRQSTRRNVLASLTLAAAAVGLAVGCGDGMLEAGWGDDRAAQSSTRPGRYIPPPEVEAAGAAQAGNIVYDDADQCIGTGNPLLPGTDRLARFLRQNFSGAGSYSDSVYCRQIVGGRSLSTHATGRAIDLFIPTIGGEADNTAGDPIANYLIQNATALGVQYFIWDRTQWNTQRGYSEDYCRGRCWEHGGSKHPHHDHLHIELSKYAARNLSTFPPINGSGGGGFSGGGTTGGGSVTNSAPDAPEGLQPDDGAQIWSDSLVMSVDPIAGATRYRFDVDYWDGVQWRAYYEFDERESSKRLWPYLDDNAYRFRVQAQNSMGWGEYSDWRVFLFQNASYPGQGPSDPADPAPADPTPADPTPADPAPPMSNAPVGTQPTAEERIWRDDVTMSCQSVSGATRYEFEIDYFDGYQWQDYYTYKTSANAKRFWPYVQNVPYRWRVRARTGGAWTDYSPYNIFLFGNADSP